MKSNKTQTVNTNEDFRDVSSEEHGEIFRMYHPMENNKSLKVDDEYMKRFNAIFGAETK